MLTSQLSVDQITITDSGVIFWREMRQIFENGVLISTLPYRSSIHPGGDLSNVPTRVAAMAQFVWTPEVIAAFQALQQQDI